MALRVGIIGAGSIGTLHTDTAANIGLTIAAVCDRDVTRAGHLAARFPGAGSTDDHTKVLADDSIDAVLIAVPNFLHARLATEALSAGKHVFLEKPMAINVAECDAVVEAMQSAQRIVQIGFVCRCAPGAIAVRRFIQEGRLGEIYHVKAAMYRRRGIPGLGKWFTTKAQSGGGALVDIGVHLIDLMLHLTGAADPERVFGTASSTHGSPIADYCTTDMWAGPRNPEGTFDVEDAVAAMIQFERMTFELNAMWAGDFPVGALRDGIVVLGDRGGCHIDLWANRIALATEQDGFVCDVTPDLGRADPWRDAWERQWRLFASAIEQVTPPNASAADGRRVQAIVDAIYRSCESGQNEPIKA